MANKTVSLVLGSGGARGLAHIGVINWLTEQGYDIRSISGTSMGALVGGIYASGHLDVYTEWVTRLERMDVLGLLDFSFGEGGLIKGERIIRVLRELIGDYQIEDLPLAFTAVATDLDNQKEIWLNKGPLFEAIRASMAIPSIFTPVTYHGMRLVDGGLLNPIPIAPTLNDKTDITIAVNLSAQPRSRSSVTRASAPAEKKPATEEDASYREKIQHFIDNLQDNIFNSRPTDIGMLDIITNSLDTMQNSIARFRLAAYGPDIIINIPSDVCLFYEFYRAKELIRFGHEITEASFNHSD
ncbi:patatin-like phospholipase family protein [Sulfuriflexus sp.]|uniref:patatin-like phospholipase family protein n=1 Tax=Sulfuriflexus sp. TaxID=2015443 RepID=UPI0028CD7EC7|nr:patatin-like phospholipase family protein [Sulfuriflexus sp.]MDT8405128.1 patatin-like phospholipase family protein [Sulfuriflexus sp.]